MSIDWSTDALDRMLADLRAGPADAAAVIDILRLESERAQRLGLAGAPAEEVAAALARSAGAAAAAGLAGMRADDPEIDGAVSLIEPGQPPRPVPPGSAAFTLGDWLIGWSAAMLARDVASGLTLCTAEVLLPAERAHGPSAAMWSAHCGLLAAAAAAPSSLPAWLGAAQSALQCITEAPPGAIETRLGPAITIAAALAERDRSALKAALADGLEAHASFFADPALAGDHARAWPLETAGLAAIAVDTGVLPGEAASALIAHLPAAAARLILGRDRPAPSLAEVTWPTAAIVTADEARWFLDLRGLPREGRRHVLVEGEAGLEAVYTASGALAPSAKARFVLVDRPDAIPAGLNAPVDAGELLALAERFAQASEGLAEALACVDAALARVPSGADAVPAETLKSRLGRAMLTEEPGRLTRERMQAYRSGLAAVAAETAPAEPEGRAERFLGPANGSDRAPEGEPGPVFEGAVAALRAAIEPILRALAEDEGETAAELTPTEADVEAVFMPAAVPTVKAALAARSAPSVDPLDWRSITMDAAPAALLSTGNALSDRFPARYRTIAGQLQPHRVWVAWRYVTEEDGSGTSYDGLVWTGSRWAWFPKPWRLLDNPG